MHGHEHERRAIREGPVYPRARSSKLRAASLRSSFGLPPGSCHSEVPGSVAQPSPAGLRTQAARCLSAAPILRRAVATPGSASRRASGARAPNTPGSGAGQTRRGSRRRLGRCLVADDEARLRRVVFEGELRAIPGEHVIHLVPVEVHVQLALVGVDAGGESVRRCSASAPGRRGPPAGLARCRWRSSRGSPGRSPTPEAGRRPDRASRRRGRPAGLAQPVVISMKLRSKQIAMETRPKSVSKRGHDVPGRTPSPSLPSVGNILS